MTRILVVDDRPLEAADAVRVLRENPDWEVDQVRTAQAALARLADVPCQLVLTDLHMPDTDGLALMTAVHEQSPTLPVVVMTSRGSELKAVQALAAGAASYLPKSRLEVDLVTTCQRVLDFARQEGNRAVLMEQMVDERFEMIIENERKHLPPLVDFIVNQCVHFGVCEPAQYPRIGVAIEEAVLNAMVHGNLEVTSELRETSYDLYEQTILERLAQQPYTDRHVNVIVELTREECRIKIRDEGPGFRPDKLRDPTDPANLCRVSGRGILLMRTFLDEVTYNDCGNEVLLVIRRSPEEPGPIADFGLSRVVSSAG